MSDSEQIQDRDPRITRSLISRIAAVGLFLTLGTFAVVQMMPGLVKKQADVTEDEGKETTPESSSGNKLQAETKTSSDKSGGNSQPKIQSNLIASVPKPSDSFQPSVPPKSNAFTPIQSFSPPSNTSPATAKKPPPQPALRTQTPKSSPPDRFAQLPQSVPIIGSNNGFAARNQSPSKPAVVDTKLPAIVKQAATDTKAAANDLIAKSQNRLESTAKKFENNIPSLNGKQSLAVQTEPARPARTKSFEPPPLRRNTSPALKAPVPKQPVVSPGLNARNNPQKSPDVSSFGNDNSFGSFDSTSQVRRPPEQRKLAAFPSKPQQQQRPSAAPRSQPNLNQNGFGQSQPAKPAPTESATVRSKTTFGDLRSFNASQDANRSTSRQSTSIQTTTAGSAPRSGFTADVPGDRALEGVQAPSLTIEKLSPREIQLNQTANFEIVVRNVGRVVAENVEVHDQIPAGTEFEGSTPKPTSVTPDRRLNWNIGSMRAGEEKRIQLQLKPTQPGEIGSVAQVSFATQASMRTLVTKPVLEIVHQTKPKVLIGEDVIVDVVVRNTGDGPAKNVLIQEDVPPQLQFQGGYRELEYEIGHLMPGETKRVQLGLKAAQVGRLKNVMFASAAGGLKARHEVDLEVIAPKLITAATGPTRRYLQRQVTHQFQVANQGTAPATNVDLVARLPAGLRFVSANNRGRYDANSHTVYWSLAELATQVDASVELVSMPVSAGQQDIQFEATADLKQQAQSTQPLNVEHLVDVFFDIDDVVDPIEIGSDTQYRIKIVNQGTKAAANVRMQLVFPNGLSPKSVQGSLQNQIQGQRVNFAPITSLRPGEQLQLVVIATGQAAGDHRVALNMQADNRQTPVTKEETTRVYADR